MPILLEEVGFRDRSRAVGNIRRFLDAVDPVAQERVQSLLKGAPDPDVVSHYLGRFFDEQRESLLRLARSATGLQCVIAVFAYSRFLSEEILQHPEWLEALVAGDDLFRTLPAQDYSRRLREFLGGSDSEIPSPLKLALFRRQQIMRIMLRDVLGYGTLSEATEELSNLADSMLDVTYRRIRQALVEKHGIPRYADEQERERECGFAVIALGKMGARELNYSSDIDLMFVYSGNGQTDGADSITNKEFFKKAANRLTDLLSTFTAEGMCYRVDLRLRPDGRLGEVCISLAGAKTYYSKRARDWELQMMIKGRVAAGEIEPGRELLDFIEPLTYSTTLDFSAVEAVSAVRERLNEKIAGKRGEFDIKLARGGIRDIEFLVQCLQRLHGGRDPWLRHGGTLLALSRLRQKDYLSDSEYSRLAEAYEYLRDLEHRLQLVEDRQTHTLPSAADELEALARRMPASDIGTEPSAERLLKTLNAHLENVQAIYERVIHAQQPLYYTSVLESQSEQSEQAHFETISEPLASNLVRFLDQRAPRLAAQLAQCPLRRGHRAFELFLEKIIASPEYLKWLESDPLLASYAFDLFENSPYFTEHLVRRPELLEQLLRLRHDPALNSYAERSATVADADALRALFREESTLIHADSICRSTDVFSTLQRSSDLADAIIAGAYRMAVRDVLRSHPPASGTPAPKDQMMVIALGRLGMREFDLGSDADLVFALPDADAGAREFWTRVAERLIDLITAYTGEGVIFAVDTRLRPNGREGALVQLESGYREYFARAAEAWEGIAYMKARGVAGNLERATEFLHELQDVDWRRYGQSGRSRNDLRAMRMRLEKEQGAGNPLKAGPGGFYDIDFALLYLRLRGAGIFFRVLNTPERIDVIEKMGHLDREDADFLRDAATLYRAVDHGLRVYSGQVEGTLPSSAVKLDALTALVHRWTPAHLHEEPLAVTLSKIGARTRQYFDRLFA